MPKTINQLLTEIKLQHNVPTNHPLLTVNVEQFHETEYCDILTIVWLWGERQLIDPAKTPAPDKKLGDESKKQVNRYYNTVKTEMIAAYKKPVKTPFRISATASWMNTTVVTHFISSNPLYILLSKSINDKSQTPAEEFIPITRENFAAQIVYKWITESFIYPEEQSKLLGLIRSEGLLCQNVKVVSELFSALSKSNAIQITLLRRIIETNYRLSKPSKYDPPTVLLEYFRDILSEVTTRFPITLEILIHGLELKIPAHLELHINKILRQNLHLVADLKTTDWPELLFYTVLFVFSQAKTNPHLVQFSYLDPRRAESLARLSRDYADYYDVFKCRYLSQPTAEFIDDLEKSLADLQSSSEIIGLLSLQNCPILRTLIMSALNCSKRTTPLLPTNNPFVIGDALYFKENMVCLSEEDFLRIMKLKHVVNRSPRLITGKPQEDAENLSTYLNTDNQKQRHFPTRFFAQEDKQKEFARIVAQITDRGLRESLTVDTVYEYKLKGIVQYQAVFDFLKRYHNSFPENWQLRDLFQLFPDERAMLLLSNQIKLLKGDEALDEDCLKDNIQELEIAIDKFQCYATSMSSHPISEGRELSIKWAKLHVILFTGFVEQLKFRLNDMRMESAFYLRPN